MERLNAEPLLEDHVFPLFTSLSLYSFHLHICVNVIPYTLSYSSQSVSYPFFSPIGLIKCIYSSASLHFW